MTVLVALRDWDIDAWVARLRRELPGRKIVTARRALRPPRRPLRGVVEASARLARGPAQPRGDLLARRGRRSPDGRRPPARRAHPARGRPRPHQPDERIRHPALPQDPAAADALCAPAGRAASGRTTGTSPPPRDVRVGIMGMGVLGQDAARKLRMIGFDVAGWSRTARSASSAVLEGIQAFAGEERPRAVPGAHGHPGLPAAADRRHARHHQRQAALRPRPQRAGPAART